jgi:hypothetical protein
MGTILTGLRFIGMIIISSLPEQVLCKAFFKGNSGVAQVLSVLGSPSSTRCNSGGPLKADPKISTTYPSSTESLIIRIIVRINN